MPNDRKMAISATQLTIFLYFFAIFLSSTGQIFSQIPQALFTELIGLTLLFSLFPSKLFGLAPHPFLDLFLNCLKPTFRAHRAVPEEFDLGL
jgi:hypothetical protein